MQGKIESGQLCTVEPVDAATLKVGDVELCKMNGKQYLHLIVAIQGKRFQIRNNRGRINGWIGENSIFGKCTWIERRSTEDDHAVGSCRTKDWSSRGRQAAYRSSA